MRRFSACVVSTLILLASPLICTADQISVFPAAGQSIAGPARAATQTRAEDRMPAQRSRRNKTLAAAAIGGLAGALAGVYVCGEVRAPQRHPNAERHCGGAVLKGAAIGASAGIIAVRVRF